MQLPTPRYTVNDVAHKYTITLPDGEKIGPLKSVTGVLGIIAKPALIAWSAREAANYFKTEILKLGRGALDAATLEQIAKDAAQAHRRKAKDAADLGSMAHSICEAIIKGQEPEAIPEQLISAIHAFKSWRLKSEMEIVATELAVASKLYMFGGRLDAVGYCAKTNEWSIIDLKSSAAVYQEHGYQCGGYAVAFEEMYGIKVTAAEIVRLGKKEPFDSAAHPITNMDEAKIGFLNALSLIRSESHPIIGDATFNSSSVQTSPAKAPAKKKGKEVPEIGF